MLHGNEILGDDDEESDEASTYSPKRYRDDVIIWKTRFYLYVHVYHVQRYTYTFIIYVDLTCI